jgi:hypothetical protein
MTVKIPRATQRSGAAHSPSVKKTSPPPPQFMIGDDIDWNAPWADITLWAELPFWLMVNNGSLTINYQDCNFPIAIHDNYFELHCNGITDSRCTVIYQGPFKEREQLSENIRRVLDDNPKLSTLRSAKRR